MRFLLLLIALLVVEASPGDNLESFKECVNVCSSYCGADSSPFPTLNPLLRLMFWDCESNCDYECQQIITKELLEDGEAIEQFHGKWPFLRILGTQELASAVFSILNFVPHYINSKKIWKKYEKTKEMKVLYFNLYLVSVITSLAWIFSTVFHIRDLNITEKLDYYFAGLTVLSGFHYLMIRTFHLYEDPKKSMKVSVVCVGMFLFHLIRLTYDWSYTYNMQANVFVAILQYSLFGVLSYRHFKKGNTELGVMPILLLASVIFGMSFELFDFYSIKFQVDAHAIWHLVTILPGFYLYEFFYKDIESLKSYID